MTAMTRAQHNEPNKEFGKHEIELGDGRTYRMLIETTATGSNGDEVCCKAWGQMKKR